MTTPGELPMVLQALYLTEVPVDLMGLWSSSFANPLCQSSSTGPVKDAFLTEHLLSYWDIQDPLPLNIVAPQAT